MKKTLLITFLCISTLGYAQTYNNSAGYYINELIASISGTDLPNEYIELRGPANGLIPAGTYLITIEGDGENSASNVGKVQEVLALGGLSFGSNGYLSIIYSTGTMYNAALVGTSANVYNETTITGYDGDLLDYSGTYLLISAPSDPTDVIVDSEAERDGQFDSTGDHTLWNIYDSVSTLDDDATSLQLEYGYGQINVATNFTTNPTLFKTPAGSSMLSIDDGSSGANVYYIARQGVSTGYNPVSDWMAGQTNSSTGPNWTFTGDLPRVSPDSMASTSLLNSTFGGPNLDPVDDGALSTKDILASKLNIYPNPAKDYITVESKSVRISSVAMYNLLGAQVISEKALVNSRLNVSGLAKGIYMLKIEAEGGTATKKIVIE